MNALSGKVALLTGSLGRAQSEALAGAGVSLILWDRPERPEGHELARTLSTQHGTTCRYIGSDLNDLAATETKCRALADEFDGTDILVNNAALIISKPFELFSIAEYEEQIRVNSSAAFALTKAVAPRMKQKGYGKIVNFCFRYSKWSLGRICALRRLQRHCWG